MWYWEAPRPVPVARPLRFWIVSTGEPLPIDGENVRLMRAGLLADELASAGHTVEWWSSTFDHPRSRSRFTSDQKIEIAASCTLRLCHARGYRRNRSLRRLQHQWRVAHVFARQARALPRPDVIVACMPTIELSLAASRYAAAAGVPLAIDIRDKWPDALLEGLPPPVDRAARWIAAPYRRSLATALGGASAILGVSPGFVRWGLDHVGRAPTGADVAFPLSNSDEPPAAESLRAADRYWERRGVGAADRRPTAVFAGALSRHFDFTSVLAVMRQFAAAGSPWRFVLAGAGPRLDELRHATTDLPNAIVPGRLDRPELWSLFTRSTVGLAPYRSGPSFSGHIPNKIIEYLSAGLPVATTLPAPLRGVAPQTDCVLTFDARDPTELGAALRRLERPGADARRWRENARELWRQRFDCRKTYPAFRAHLEHLATSRDRG